MKKKSNRVYAEALWKATQEISGDDLKIVLQNFAELLARHRALARAPSILEEFDRLEHSKSGKRIFVTTMIPLDADTRAQISQAFGGAVQLTEHVKPEILGGIIVRDGDIIFDGSLKKQLHLLKNSLVT